MRIPGKRLAIIAMSALSLAAVYLGTYVVLSAMGNYQFSQSGRYRYSFGLAMSDVNIWQPCGARWELYRSVGGDETTRGNALGYLFSPLIRLDRGWFHPTRQVFD